MICKVCGTNNEDYLEYCKKCSAPLHGSDNADNGAEAPASPRSFVRSPVWAKPEFNANTISENDIPADFLNGKSEEMIKDGQVAPDTVVYMDYGSGEMKNRTRMGGQFGKACTLLLKKNILLNSRIVPGGEHCEASWEKQIPFFMGTLLYDLP